MQTQMCTLLSCGVLRMCTALGLTPLALALRYRAKRLFLRPRSPLGREPLYLERGTQKQAQDEDASTDIYGRHSNESRRRQQLMNIIFYKMLERGESSVSKKFKMMTSNGVTLFSSILD